MRLDDDENIIAFEKEAQARHCRTKEASIKAREAVDIVEQVAIVGCCRSSCYKRFKYARYLFAWMIPHQCCDASKQKRKSSSTSQKLRDVMDEPAVTTPSPLQKIRVSEEKTETTHETKLQNECESLVNRPFKPVPLPFNNFHDVYYRVFV